MQRNAVILQRARSRTKATHIDSSDEEYENEQTLDDALQRIEDEEKKFYGFWIGVTNIVDSYHHKRKIEKKKSGFVHGVAHQQPLKRWVIHPEHPMKILWDLFMALFVLYSVVIIPYRVGFDIKPSDDEINFDNLITALFGIDILVAFNTAYLDANTEKFVFRRRFIALEYIRFWFWIDLLAMIPFDGITDAAIHTTNLSAIRIIRILRLVRLFKLNRFLTQNRQLEKLPVNPAITNLIGLMLQIFFIAHVFACFWHYIALPNTVGTFSSNWIEHFSYSDATAGSRYVASLYYIVVTMMTVGYGDIFATNQLERFYAIVTMLVGGIVFGALVQKLASIIDKRNPQAQAYNQKMHELKLFLVETGLPMEIRNRAKVAYSYYLTKKSSFGESGIFENLPTYILHELVSELYDSDISKVGIFRTMEASFVVHLVIHSRPMQVVPNEVVFEEGDVCTDIMFIKSGTIRLLCSDGSKNMLTGCVTEGGMFGDVEYFRKTTAMATYSAARHCQLLAVSHTVFTKAMGEHYRSSQRVEAMLKDRADNLVSVIRSRASLEAVDEHRPAAAANKKNLRKIKKVRKKKTLSKKKGFENRMKLLYVDGDQRDLYSSLKHIDVDADRNAAVSAAGSRSASENVLRVLEIKGDGTARVVEVGYSKLAEKRVLHPQGKYKLYWDFFIAMLILYSVLIIPVEIAFQQDAYRGSSVFNLVIAGFFFVDIFLGFRTAFDSLHHDALVISRVLIGWNYVRGWFWIDLVSTIPFDAILEAASGEGSSNLAFTQLLKTVRLLRLLRIMRIFKLGIYLEKIEDFTGISPVLFQLLALLAQVFFMVHIICCLWWGLTDMMSPDPWYVKVLPSKGGSVAAKYIVSIYFTFTTMTTVGYGDLGPTNTPEQILCIFLVIAGASIFGYMIANVSNLLTAFDGSAGTGTEKLAEITEYLNEKECPSDLSNKILTHFQRQFKDQSAFDVDGIASCLPPMLAAEILTVLHGKKMSKIPIFKYIPNKTVQLHLFSLMNPAYYEEGRYIIREGDDANEIIFLIAGTARAFKKEVKLMAVQRKFMMNRQASIRGPIANFSHSNSITLVHEPLETVAEGKEEEDESESNRHLSLPRQQSIKPFAASDAANITASNMTLHRPAVEVEDAEDSSEEEEEGDDAEEHLTVTRDNSSYPEADDSSPAEEFQRMESVGFTYTDTFQKDEVVFGTSPARQLSPKFQLKIKIDHPFGSRQPDTSGLEMTNRGEPQRSLSPAEKKTGVNSSPNNERHSPIAPLGNLHRMAARGYNSVNASPDRPSPSGSVTPPPRLSPPPVSSSNNTATGRFGFGKSSSQRSTSLRDSLRFSRLPSGPNSSKENNSPKTSPAPLDRRFSGSQSSRRLEQQRSTGSSAASPGIFHQLSSNSSDSRVRMLFSIGGPSLRDTLSKLFSDALHINQKIPDPLDELGVPFSTLTDADFADNGFKLLGDVHLGDFVGHVAFMSGSKHDASVRTIEPSTVYTFSKNEMAKLIRMEPSIGIQLQSAIARSIIAQAGSVGRFHMRAGRASFLKDLKYQYFDVNSSQIAAEALQEKKLQSEDSAELIRDSELSLSDRDSSFSNPATPTTPTSRAERRKRHHRSSIQRQGMIFRDTLVGAIANKRHPRVVESLFSDQRVWYNSDDSKSDGGTNQSNLTKKSNRKSTGKTAANYVSKTITSISSTISRSKHSKLSKLNPNKILKRSYSMSEMERTHVSSVNALFPKKNKTSKPLLDTAHASRPGMSTQASLRGTLSRASSLSTTLKLVREKKQQEAHDNADALATKYKLARRQSFPSFDNEIWKESNIHQGVVL